jgi:hypothetical protein
MGKSTIKFFKKSIKIQRGASRKEKENENREMDSFVGDRARLSLIIFGHLGRRAILAREGNLGAVGGKLLPLELGPGDP